ncbi:hypothetical protein CEP52_005529 [Fusarium oligoseptatum]|uniref:Uncharacterized protein n=1 Tax=Fusarium oligoseptatum TaxID=2604345 RepID=A0A428TXV5_9HYPO|nr:hypothetical protein CEP52_005529 [Fusarium oligoseptatum]
MAEESIRRRERQEGGYENCTTGFQQHIPEELRDRRNSLLANRHFSDAEREWINVRYGDLKTFLDWFRYKLYELDEIKETKKHLQWLMWMEGKLKEGLEFLGIR